MIYHPLESQGRVRVAQLSESLPLEQAFSKTGSKLGTSIGRKYISGFRLLTGRLCFLTIHVFKVLTNSLAA